MNCVEFDRQANDIESDRAGFFFDAKVTTSRSSESQNAREQVTKDHIVFCGQMDAKKLCELVDDRNPTKAKFQVRFEWIRSDDDFQ